MSMGYIRQIFQKGYHFWFPFFFFFPFELVRKNTARPIFGKHINLIANFFLTFLDNLCNLFIKKKVNDHHCYEKHGVNDHQK